MTNADKFREIFGIYATELWAMPENEFLKWLNSVFANDINVPNKNGRKATQKMMDYATAISNIVCEKMPDTDDFTTISAYISRNVKEYRDHMKTENYALLASTYHGEYFDL